MMRNEDGPSRSDHARPTGELSLTVEETNKLRLSLGLRPLRTVAKSDRPIQSVSTDVSPRPDQFGPPPRAPACASTKPAPQLSAAAAAILQDSGFVKHDSDEDADEDDVRAWVSKLRTKSMSAAPVETSNKSNEEVSRNENETEKGNLHLRHSELDEMAVGQNITLTLADQNVLDDTGTGLQVDGDVLVDVVDRANLQAKLNSKLRKGYSGPVYNPIDDNEFEAPGGGGKKQAVLAKYDDEENEISYEVDERGQVSAIAKERDGGSQGGFIEEGQIASVQERYNQHRALVKEKLRNATVVSAFVDHEHDSATAFESAYYTPAEFAETFKKRKRSKMNKERNGKRKKRQRHTEDDVLAGPASEGQDLREIETVSEQVDEVEKNRPSRIDQIRREAEEKQRVLDMEDDDDEAAVSAVLAAVQRTQKARAIVEECTAGTKQTPTAFLVLQHANEASARVRERSMDENTKNEEVLIVEEEHFLSKVSDGIHDEKRALRAQGSNGDQASFQKHDGPLRVQASHPVDSNQESVKDPGTSTIVPEAFKGYHDIHAEKTGSDDKDELDRDASITMTAAQALARFRDLGAMKQRRTQEGRARDKLFDLNGGPAADGKSVKLVYTDEKGNEVTQKEAFRIMSHKFHGKGPGQNKREARLRRQLQNAQLHGRVVTDDTPLGSLSALRSETEKSGRAHVVLSGAAAIQSHGSLSWQRQDTVLSKGVAFHPGDSEPCATRDCLAEVDGSGKKRNADEDPRGGDTTAQSTPVQFTLGGRIGAAAKRSRRG